MKFLCVPCDEAMRLVSTAGPDEGSLTVGFACPRCGHRIAMLTNPWETQLVRTLGVKVGGAAEPSPPFADVRATLARQREDAFVGEGVAGPPPPSPSVAAAEGPGCPFAAMIPRQAEGGGALSWTPEAEARIARIPAFIRPMARQAIERFAGERGYGTVTEAVLDEAREAMGL